MIRLTDHALKQLMSRGIARPSEVIQAVSRYERSIIRSKVYDVRVIIKRTTFQFLPDGSNGDVVVACVTPDGVVKTVMLQREEQVRGKMRNKSIAYFE